MSTATWNFLDLCLKRRWQTRLYSIGSTICFQMYLYEDVPFFNHCQPMSLQQSLFGDELKINLKEGQCRQIFPSFSAWWSQPEFLMLKFQLSTDVLKESSAWLQRASLHMCCWKYFVPFSPLLTEALNDLQFCIFHQLSLFWFQLRRLWNRFGRRLVSQVSHIGLLKELSSLQG